jgi:hypothetical protein
MSDDEHHTKEYAFCTGDKGRGVAGYQRYDQDHRFMYGCETKSGLVDLQGSD